MPRCCWCPLRWPDLRYFPPLATCVCFGSCHIGVCAAASLRWPFWRGWLLHGRQCEGGAIGWRHLAHCAALTWRCATEAASAHVVPAAAIPRRCGSSSSCTPVRAGDVRFQTDNFGQEALVTDGQHARLSCTRFYQPCEGQQRPQGRAPRTEEPYQGPGIQEGITGRREAHPRGPQAGQPRR